MVILSVIGALFRSNHPSMVGGTGDPEDGPKVAATVFTAVIVYAVCLHAPFCKIFGWYSRGGNVNSI